jgi:hypothetical protein
VPGYNYVGYECIDNDAFHRVNWSDFAFK